MTEITTLSSASHNVPATLDVADTPIGTLVADYPQVEEVLEDFGFDTCCTVEFTPLELADKAAIDAEPLIAALRQAVGQ
jgi:iron-sulfur cluster repair protein YtfE (RIC family)